MGTEVKIGSALDDQRELIEFPGWLHHLSNP